MYKTLVLFFTSFVILSSCFSGRQISKRTENKKVKKNIEIGFNVSEDYLFGIPIQCLSKSLIFCIADGDEIFVTGDDNQFFIFNLSNDILYMKCTGKPYVGEGKFILLPIPKTEYRTFYDPETYYPTIRPVYYYDPVKIGKWIIKSDSTSFEKIYSFSFNLNPLKEIYCTD